MALTQYCDEADVIAAYGNTFWLDIADDNDDGITNGVAPALAWASGRVNAYVGAKYALPLAVIPGDLKQIAVDLTVYRRASRGADVMTKNIMKLKDEAISDLEKIRDGDTSLGLENPPASHVNGVVLTANDRIFTKAEWDLQ